MKNILLLMLLTGFGLTGCRTAFPEAQTPDDVYYSPEGSGGDYVRTETDEDRYLRMKVRNRREWNELSDWYSYERWSYGMNYAYGTPFHPYFNWNVIHNPYWTTTGTNRPPNRPRVSNLNSYQPSPSTNLSSPVSGNPKLNPVRTTTTTYSPGNNNRSVGGGLRELFGSDNKNTNTSQPPANSGNPSNSTQSAPVRKF